MKTLTIAAVLLLYPLCSHAEGPLPSMGIVESAIVSAKDNKLDQFIQSCDLVAIGTAKTGPVSPNDAMRILKNVDLKKSSVNLHEEKDRTIVLIAGQGARIELTLEKEELTTEGLYRIVAILVGKE